MQDFAIFDLIILAVTLILGLKGLFRGLIKEVFGIIGIIGAIFVASRISKEIGDLIAPILVLENEATIKLIGFITALVAVWLVVYSAGVIVSKIFSASGLGVVDRIFGFVFGAAKIFLIFSVIAYALYQVQSFKKVIVTHHVPTMLNYPPQYKGSVINQAFATELSEFIEENEIDYWLYGHHHYNSEIFEIGKTKLLTNQLGYVRSNEHFGYRNDAIFEI